MIFGKNQEKGKDFCKKIFDFDFLFLSFIVDILYRIFGEKSNFNYKQMQEQQQQQQQ